MTFPSPTNTPPIPGPSDRIIGADGLRAFAALAVFVCHVARLGPAVPEPWTFPYRLMDQGTLGVAIFFVLSGFLLSQPFWKALHAGKPMPSIHVYARKRIARIVPACYVNIIILTLITGSLTTRWGMFEAFTTFTFTSSLFSATFCPSFNGVLWSIGIEFLFYIMLPIFALGLWLFQAKSIFRAWTYTLTIIALILLAQLALLHYAPQLEQLVSSPALLKKDGWNITRNAPILFTHFLIGVLTADLFLRWAMPKLRSIPKPRGYNRYDLLATSLILAMLAIPINAAAQGPSLGIKWVGYDWPTYHLLVAGLLLFVPFSGYVSTLLDHWFLRYTADISYGIYIWHMPILELLRHHWPQNSLSPSTQQILFALLGLILTYLLASLSYYTLEKPLLRWAHR